MTSKKILNFEKLYRILTIHTSRLLQEGWLLCICVCHCVGKKKARSVLLYKNNKDSKLFFCIRFSLFMLLHTKRDGYIYMYNVLLAKKKQGYYLLFKNNKNTCVHKTTPPPVKTSSSDYHRHHLLVVWLT